MNQSQNQLIEIASGDPIHIRYVIVPLRRPSITTWTKFVELSGNEVGDVWIILLREIHPPLSLIVASSQCAADHNSLTLPKKDWPEQ